MEKVKNYMGCGAEVQNYDRASFTLKVNAHRCVCFPARPVLYYYSIVHYTTVLHSSVAHVR